MRIVSGEFRGRRIDAPKGDKTRPTTDRVREAVFSAISSIAGPDLGGGSVLDAFAGSGALGLEAVSRGCSSATFVERDRGALNTLKRNIETLGVTARTRVVVGDSFALARGAALPGAPFALLLLDPPYRLETAEVGGLIGALASRDLLEDGCVVVWERASEAEAQWPHGFSAVKVKRYGTTSVEIGIYERGAASS